MNIVKRSIIVKSNFYTYTPAPPGSHNCFGNGPHNTYKSPLPSGQIPLEPKVVSEISIDKTPKIETEGSFRHENNGKLCFLYRKLVYISNTHALRSDVVRIKGMFQA